MEARTLRLLDPNGEVADDAPASYAEALLELQNAQAKAERLQEENGHLTQVVKRTQIQLQRMKAQQHKDLRLHKDYAAVERLWGKYREWHKRCGEDVPEDYLKLALDRLKDFDEYALARALDGARTNPPTSDDGKMTYDRWDNVFRSTGHVHRYIERADIVEGRVRQPGGRVVALPPVLQGVDPEHLAALARECECGEPFFRHTDVHTVPGFIGCRASGCPNFDDTLVRMKEWEDRQRRRRR